MPIAAETDWLRANSSAGEIGVDREKNAIFGAVLAQEGAFKSEGRGEFDLKSLKQIVTLARKKPEGLKSRFGHPTLSNDGLGSYLGRIKNVRLDSVRVKRDDGPVLLHAVRGDLFFDPTALETPPEGGRPLGDYVMARAESDPGAISSSLVLQADKEEQLDPKTKRPLLDAKGNPRSPLWRPTKLHASDVVFEGDAVDDLLSFGVDVDSMPDAIVRKASEMLDAAFGNATRDVVRARCLSWLDRYLATKFWPEQSKEIEMPEEDARLLNAKKLSREEADRLRRRIFLMEHS